MKKLLLPFSLLCAVLLSATRGYCASSNAVSVSLKPPPYPVVDPVPQCSPYKIGEFCRGGLRMVPYCGALPMDCMECCNIPEPRVPMLPSHK
jgi:hypothetical protein